MKRARTTSIATAVLTGFLAFAAAPAASQCTGCTPNADCQADPACMSCVSWEQDGCHDYYQNCLDSHSYTASCGCVSAQTCDTGTYWWCVSVINGCTTEANATYCEGVRFCEDLYSNNDVPPSPIVVSRDGRFQYTSVSAWFDIDADGIPEHIGWVDRTGGDALLAMDRNGNGVIDNGAELFGTATPQATYHGEEPNGFIALRELDASGDGVVSGAELAGIVLWRDDGDANSEPGELVPIEDTGILYLSTKYFTRRGRDRYGNLRRWFGTGDGVHLEDVVFVSETP